ncbi:duf300 domain-containing protein [Phlyctema vagabunda]|uniref:Duf300 domain-containing protein n=1 Tax=Phlyctema vagabunda TaxID=108571 RepID=A0ABR4PU56_9HELO
MGLSFNTTCNATLDEMRIGTSEEVLVGNMTFHSLAIIIAAAAALTAILVSFYLIWMHATHYTRPYEQRHIIRILFMIPVYAASAFLQIWFYWHAIYFQVISDCYEAFAIASFFALLCHYLAPNLHEQKDYFRGIVPKPWVWPVNWFAACCGGQRGPWRIPRSGLTWFNIVWSGVYQYCFVRVSMTVTAVITQYFGRYCEASNSPVFAHIWILVLEGAAVTVAMYCLIQFYIQLRKDLSSHSPFLKVLAIKLVIFLSFWQSFMISILTSSTLNVISPTQYLAYPDLKVGVPALLLCIEMAIFAVLHLFAFPWKPYSENAAPTKYPLSPATNGPSSDHVGPKQGGFLGVKALVDAMNPWDMVTGFARAMRWLFFGVKNRESDLSYKNSTFNSNVATNDNDMSLQPTAGKEGQRYQSTDTLPIANEFRRSKFGISTAPPSPGRGDEGAGLIAHAQPNPLNHGGSGYVPARERYDINGQDISEGGTMYPNQPIGLAISEPEPYQSYVQQNPYVSNAPSNAYLEQVRNERRQQSPSQQWAQSQQPIHPEETGNPQIHNALWGQPPRPQDGPRGAAF